MKAKAFDEIWMIIDKEPLAQLDSEKLAKLFNKHKNLKDIQRGAEPGFQ